MLQNAYLDVKIGVDTDENEPKKSDVSWLILQLRIARPAETHTESPQQAALDVVVLSRLPAALRC